MCRVYSCIVTRTGKVYGQDEDPSHTEIARRHNLPEDGKSELLRAKVEIVPRSGRGYGHEPTPENWKLIVDEPSKPDWWGDRGERNAWAACRKWWKAHVLSDGEHVVESGLWIVLGSSAPVITQSGGAIWARGSSAPVVTRVKGEE